MVSVAALGAAQAVVAFLGTAVLEAAREETTAAVRTRFGRLLRRRRGGDPADLADSAAEPSDEGESDEGESDGNESDEGGAPVAPDPAVARLSPEQVRELRRIAVEKARAAGVEQERAELIADAIVGGLLP